MGARQQNLVQSAVIETARMRLYHIPGLHRGVYFCAKNTEEKMTTRIKVKSLNYDCMANWDEKEIDGDIWIKANNEEEFADLVKAMMFNNIEDFEELTEIPKEDLIGKFFFLMSSLSRTNKVYVEGRNDNPIN
jgi:hypothetical protein